jgi:serine/threonine protein kinase
MITCEIPFRKALSRQHKAILTDPQRARTDENWNIEPEAIDLVSKMISIDPKARPTITQIRSHRWMSQETATLAEVEEFYYTLY